MRMRELERLSGVGRETVRYYIREGLLPEPARASRNSASYSDAHVARLRAIKRLQEERFLPLSLIRTLLDSDGADTLRVFPQLDAVLRARLDRDDARVPADSLFAELGLERAAGLDTLAAGGCAIADDGTLSARDAAILHVLAGLETTGFTAERGFTPDMVRFYVAFIDRLTSAEVKLFVGQIAGRVGAEESADMAERGVAAINELLGLLRTRALLAKLAARRYGTDDSG